MPPSVHGSKGSDLIGGVPTEPQGSPRMSVDSRSRGKPASGAVAGARVGVVNERRQQSRDSSNNSAARTGISTLRPAAASSRAITPTSSPAQQEQQKQEQGPVENGAPSTGTPNDPYSSSSLLGGGMMGYGGLGMLGSPYGMMSPMYGGGYGGGPLSGLNQMLFGAQQVIFSLAQAVQIVGMNSAALKQLMENALAMFEHAVATWHEVRALEREASRGEESEEDRKRRRRLRAVRWTLVVASTYAGYRLLRRVFGYGQQQRKRALLQQQPYSNYDTGGAGRSYYGDGYGSPGMGGMPPPSSPYHGGGYY